MRNLLASLLSGFGLICGVLVGCTMPGVATQTAPPAAF
jgi:hypothetical protein